MVGIGGLSRRGRGWIVAAVGAALLGFGPAALAQDPPGLAYEFDAPLAPVCIDGTFPLTIDLPSIDVEGTLQATTNAKGRVTGTFSAGVAVFTATGKVKYRTDEDSTLKLTLKAAGQRITCQGILAGTDFAGTTSGRGTLAPGKHTFVLDLSSAQPSVARVSILFSDTGTPKILGAGQVLVCGDPLPVTGTRIQKTARTLTVKGKGFKFTGAGPIDVDPNLIMADWTAKGFGAVSAGTGLDLGTVLPPAGLSYADPVSSYVAEEPSGPNVPTVGGGPARTWSVAPPLPEGLVVDPLTGVLSGAATAPAPAADYTVTVSNLAGSTNAMINVEVTANPGYSMDAVSLPISDDDIRHFLTRTHFGVKQSEFDAVKAMGLDAYLDDILAFQIPQAELDAQEELVNGTDPPGYEGKFPNDTQIARWWCRIMAETDRPFQEKLAFFWHDRIPTASPQLGAGRKHWFIDYANIFRHGGAGNFRSMMVQVSRDPSMLTFLDGDENTAAFPNENYAREFWELFTLGVDNGYTQADIVEGARCFTGYRRRFNNPDGLHTMEFNASRHDEGDKTIFGALIPGQDVTDDYQAIVDATFDNRPVAEFITTKLFEEFCFAAPPQSTVDAMATILRDANYELAPFLKALFLSKAFYSTKGKADMVKTPLEFIIGFVRSTGLQVPIANLENEISLLGQRPAHPPSVNGWPTGTLWYSSSSMVNRTNFMAYNAGQAGNQRAAGIVVEDILPPVVDRTAPNVVDALTLLLRVTLTTAERQQMIDFLNSFRQANGTIVVSPFDGSDQGHLDQRVRNLLVILTQHPTYQVK